MEVNPQLVEQVNNARDVILSVESEYYAFNEAVLNLAKVECFKRSPLGWVGVFFCCYSISLIPIAPIALILEKLSMTLTAIICTPIFVLVFAFCWFYWVIFRKKEKIEKYTNEMNLNRDILDDQFEKYADILSVIPEDYQNPEAIRILAQIVNSGRALNMQEALNLTEDEFHKKRVEEMNQEMLSKLDDIMANCGNTYIYYNYH